jgi:hypothetical protein
MQTRIFTLSSFDPGNLPSGSPVHAADTLRSACGVGDIGIRCSSLHSESIITIETAEYK